MIKINLAPPEARGRRRGLGISLPAATGTFAVGLLCAVLSLGVTGYYVVLSRDAARLERGVQETSRDLAMLKAALGTGAKVRDDLAELNKRAQAVAELTKNQGTAIQILDAFADVVPRDLWITTLEERGPEIRAVGTAFSATAIADFMSNLRSSGKFKDIEIVVAKQESGKSAQLVTFEVTCRFGG
jgi:Tfp pilus assembly protein PilN